MSMARMAAFAAALMVLGGTPVGAQTTEASAGRVATQPKTSVGPGDKIELRIFMEPELTGEYDVNEQGEVVLPKLGAVPVAGLEIDSLRALLHREFGRYLRQPALEVTALRRVAVHGEIKEPMLYWVDLTMTLRDVIAEAGGLTDAGDPGKITVVRGAQQIDASRFGTLEIPLESGDQIVVGRRNWFVLNTPYVISTAISLGSILAGIILAN